VWFFTLGGLLFNLHGQLRIKRVYYLQSGLYHESHGKVICVDSDHNGLNELIFYTGTIYATDPLRWEVWEHRPMNRYELVFADTGAYPYPQGITTGNFRPYDVGDIDRDSLIDLVGPNIDQQQNYRLFYNVVSTQESPNYSYYPENLSWWYRYTNNAAISEPFYFTSDLDNDGNNEIIFAWDSIYLFENISNNQNNLIFKGPPPANSFTFGDFDLDNRKEFITAWMGSAGRVFVYENTLDNQFVLVYVDTTYRPNGSDVFSGQDLDGDGKPEFLVGFYSYPSSTHYLYKWESTGNNTYQRQLIDQKVYSADGPGRSKCGDIDGDGIEELVWATPRRLYIYKAVGNDQFQQVWEWWQDHGTDDHLCVNIYDMNNNGYKEIVVGGSGKTSIFEIEVVRLLRPNGGEVFQDSTQELIRWQKFYPPRCDSLSLFYSINNGNTYNLITHGLSGNDTSYLWTVPNVNSDSCKIKIIAYGPGWQYDESDGIFSITSTGINEITSPNRVAMTLGVKVYPSPAKSLSVIHYTLPVESKISLQLYDISGRLIKTLVDVHKKPGNYSLTLNSRTLSAGVYFLSLETEEKRIIERIVIIK